MFLPLTWNAFHRSSLSVMYFFCWYWFKASFHCRSLRRLCWRDSRVFASGTDRFGLWTSKRYPRRCLMLSSAFSGRREVRTACDLNLTPDSHFLTRSSHISFFHSPLRRSSRASRQLEATPYLDRTDRRSFFYHFQKASRGRWMWCANSGSAFGIPRNLFPKSALRLGRGRGRTCNRKARTRHRSYLSICLFIHLCIYLFICQSVYLSVYLSVY